MIGTIGVNITKQFRRPPAFVATNPKGDNIAIAILHRKLGYAHSLLRAEMPYGIKNPDQRDIEVAFSALPTALEALKDRREVLLAIQTDPNRNVNFGMQHIFRFELFHQAVGDEFVVARSLQERGDVLERGEKTREVR